MYPPPFSDELERCLAFADHHYPRHSPMLGMKISNSPYSLDSRGPAFLSPSLEAAFPSKSNISTETASNSDPR